MIKKDYYLIRTNENNSGWFMYFSKTKFLKKGLKKEPHYLFDTDKKRGKKFYDLQEAQNILEKIKVEPCAQFKNARVVKNNEL